MQYYSTTPQAKETIEALWRLEKIILDSLDFKEVVQKIVDSVLTELGYLKLGYRIVVLALVDQQEEALKRISISQTEEAKKALAVTPVPFEEIVIPLNADNNYCIKALKEGQPFVTTYWPDILIPPYKNAEDAVAVQKAVGIKTSMVYPVMTRSKPTGILIFSMVKEEKEVTGEERDLIRGFTDVVGLAVQNARLYTSLEETKDQLEKANIRLEELDKLKDDFVSVASHELRTPMTAIKSYIWIALNKYGKIPVTDGELPKSNGKYKVPDDLQRYMSRAYISVERLIDLVNDMLNISRIESGRIALRLLETDLLELAKDVIDEVSAKAREKSVKINLTPAKISKVLADPDKIHEVYLNLIGNALKFTPNGGTITVDFKEKNPFIYVSITDTGVGIHKEDLARLFTKFGRLDNSYVASASSGGTGLGLFISKSLIEIHKGSIMASSEGEGRGTTFTFSLPMVGTQIARKLHLDAPQETVDTKDLEKTSVNVI